MARKCVKTNAFSYLYLIQSIEFQLSKFVRLNQSYHILKARIGLVGKNKLTAILLTPISPIEEDLRDEIRSFWSNYAAKHFLQKTLKISVKLIFSKWAKIFIWFPTFWSLHFEFWKIEFGSEIRRKRWRWAYFLVCVSGHRVPPTLNL